MSIGNSRDRSDMAPSPQDWLLDNENVKLFEQFLEEEITLNTKYDIPYTAGYSKDARTIYIDRSVPQYLMLKSGTSRLKKIKFDIWKSFCVHEMVEKSLEDMPYFWVYDISHEIALRGERLYVESKGVDWNDYNKQTLKIVDDIQKKNTFEIPKNLDLEPYVDSKDVALLKKMGYDAEGKKL